MPQLKRFKVSGIFEAGYNEFDKGLAVVQHARRCSALLRMGEGVTGVRLKLHDMDQAWDVARDLAAAAGAARTGSATGPARTPTCSAR